MGLAEEIYLALSGFQPTARAAEKLAELGIHITFGAITAVLGVIAELSSQSRNSQEREYEWALAQYRKICGEAFSVPERRRGDDNQRLGGRPKRSRRYHDIITGEGMSREGLLDEMLALRPCKEKE